MILVHKIQPDPTRAQITELSKACGCARVAYNRALAEWTKQYQAGLKPKANELKKQFNTIKESQFPWIYESPKGANQHPFANLGKAFQSFFKKKTKYPTFKKKGHQDSFRPRKPVVPAVEGSQD